jgi:hypothetical protein
MNEIVVHTLGYKGLVLIIGLRLKRYRVLLPYIEIIAIRV